jgi:cytochrome c biogenesis protein CcmG/thiol:disulfide interchange protein DsbE
LRERPRRGKLHQPSKGSLRGTGAIASTKRQQDLRKALAAAVAAGGATVVLVLLLQGAASTVRSAADGACGALRPSPLSSSLRSLEADFTLPDLGGRPVSMRALRGRPVLLSFFATWCPPCIEEAPSLERLARRLGDKATVLVVSVDEDVDALKRFYAQGSTATVVRDETKKVPARFGTSKYPESFLIDKGGRVRYAFINQRDWGVPEAAACVEGLN